MGGCSLCPVKKETIYVYSTCPEFKKKIDIDIIKHNNKEARISWDDVQELSNLAKAQKEFNKSVQKMNKENRQQIKNGLNQN